jgi:hypothetical protein
MRHSASLFPTISIISLIATGAMRQVHGVDFAFRPERERLLGVDRA